MQTLINLTAARDVSLRIYDPSNSKLKLYELLKIKGVILLICLPADIDPVTPRHRVGASVFFLLAIKLSSGLYTKLLIPRVTVSFFSENLDIFRDEVERNIVIQLQFSAVWQANCTTIQDLTSIQLTEIQFQLNEIQFQFYDYSNLI